MEFSVNDQPVAQRQTLPVIRDIDSGSSNPIGRMTTISVMTYCIVFVCRSVSVEMYLCISCEFPCAGEYVIASERVYLSAMVYVSVRLPVFLFCMHISISLFLHVYFSMCVSTYACISVCLHTCLCICVYVCLQICRPILCYLLKHLRQIN